jgi:hypothetical protein
MHVHAHTYSQTCASAHAHPNAGACAPFFSRTFTFRGGQLQRRTQGAQTHPEEEDDSSEDHQPLAKNGALLTWCGNPNWSLEVWIDGSVRVPYWSQQSHGKLELPMASGKYECCVCRAGGEGVWNGTVVVEEGAWTCVDTGELFDKVVSDPQGRSQFSFDDGRVRTFLRQAVLLSHFYCGFRVYVFRVHAFNCEQGALCTLSVRVPLIRA